MKFLKFRVWDKTSENIFQLISIDFEREFAIYKNEEYTTFASLNEIEMMQFTGLYDKNDWEIYEGDIIFDEYYEEYGEVTFFEGAFAVEHDGWRVQLSECNKDLIVVGHIYEMPSNEKEQ